MSDHPAHPAFVHHPIAFWSVSYLIDLAYGAATHPATAKTVAGIYNIAPYLGDMAKFAYYLNILGILFAFPAIFTGVPQLLQMTKNQDLKNKFEKSQNKSVTAQKMHPKMKLGFAHAVTIYSTFGLSIYSWFLRRQTATHAPDQVSFIIAGASFLLLNAAGYLGAAMVYDHGVGVVRASSAKKDM